jgi:hypothetical protein
MSGDPGQPICSASMTMMRSGRVVVPSSARVVIGWELPPLNALGRSTTLTKMSRIFTTSFASVYPHYVTKLEKKGRTKAELDQVIEWLTGFDESALSSHLAAGTTFEDFFADARLNAHASLITGVVCGVRVEQVEDPLMQQIRYLDKLVDELAKGKSMDRILRA